jgi:hypothetical protein
VRSSALDLVSIPRFIQKTVVPAALTLVALHYRGASHYGFEVVGGHASPLVPG